MQATFWEGQGSALRHSEMIKVVQTTFLEDQGNAAKEVMQNILWDCRISNVSDI